MIEYDASTMTPEEIRQKISSCLTNGERLYLSSLQDDDDVWNIWYDFTTNEYHLESLHLLGFRSWSGWKVTKDEVVEEIMKAIQRY